MHNFTVHKIKFCIYGEGHHPQLDLIDLLRTVRTVNFAGTRPGAESGTGTGTGESLVGTMRRIVQLSLMCLLTGFNAIEGKGSHEL